MCDFIIGQEGNQSKIDGRRGNHQDGATVVVADSSPSPAGSTYTTASESGTLNNDAEAANFPASTSEVDPASTAAALAVSSAVNKVPLSTGEALSISPASTVTSSGMQQPESARQTPVSAISAAEQPPVPQPQTTIVNPTTTSFDAGSVSHTTTYFSLQVFSAFAPSLRLFSMP